NHKKIAVAIAAMWKKALGVESTLSNQEFKVFLTTRKEKKQTQAFRAGWIGDYNDPYTFLELFSSTSKSNDVGFKSEKFDQLLTQAGQEQDLSKRAGILKEAEQEFTDAYAIAPIYSYVSKRLVKPYVKGYQANVMDHVPSKYLSIEKK
ncbi:MAG: ABC transporter substrate-binding protein, partial [Cardiobacteriaceae bacterium]|nr:ABC transporter substrate-binding protein [Cardiobacteriaceae bacterium]